MGAAGDMLCAALLELHPQPEKVVEQVNALGLPGVRVAAERMQKCGITGTHYAVTVHGEEETQNMPHHHHGGAMHDITALIDGLDLPDAVKADAKAVYDLVAQAESRVHGCTIEHIHFHELGTLDAVTDIVTCCLLLHELAPERITASPVCTGFGTVRCAHGILPVPAPATAVLLEGVPVYAGTLEAELCTPTGAALLKHFVQDFGPMPAMMVSAVGYGMGGRDFERANCLRAMLGDAEDGDEIIELTCNVDDMTPEAVGFAMQTLLDAGAPEVFTEAVGMKKNRPGILITCLCRRAQRDEMVRLLFRHTSTIGIRETVCRRYVLRRETGTVETPYGPVHVKTSEGYGVRRSKAEYDDLARIASANGLTLDEVRKLAELK